MDIIISNKPTYNRCRAIPVKGQICSNRRIVHSYTFQWSISLVKFAKFTNFSISKQFYWKTSLEIVVSRLIFWRFISFCWGHVHISYCIQNQTYILSSVFALEICLNMWNGWRMDINYFFLLPEQNGDGITLILVLQKLFVVLQMDKYHEFEHLFNIEAF